MSVEPQGGKAKRNPSIGPDVAEGARAFPPYGLLVIAAKVALP